MKGPNSFILSNSSKDESKAAKLLSPYSKQVRSLVLGNYQLWWNCEISGNEFKIEVKEGSLLVLGTARPLSANTTIDRYWIKQQWSNNFTQLFSLISGSYCFIHFDYKRESITIYNNPLGEFPIYFFKSNDQLFVTSEIKVIPNLSVPSSKLVAFGQFVNIQNRKNDFCIFQNWKKLKPQHCLKIKNDSISVLPLVLKKEFHKSILEILTEQLQQRLWQNTRCCLPLSSGIDSATVGSLLHKKNLVFDSYTIGTEFGNEFDGARISSQFVQSINHTELAILQEEFWTAFIHGIYLNEFTHPTYAEGYVGYYKIMEASSTHTSKVMTGYGADVLLGDIGSNTKMNTIDFVQHYINQGNISGEFHPFMAHYFNQEIVHLYWNVRMLNYSLQLSDRDKSHKNTSKVKFRKQLQEAEILPDEIIYLKKQAFHTGAGFPRMLNVLLSRKDDDYHYKTKVLYIILKLLFEGQISYKEITLLMVREKLESYDFK